MNHSHFLLTALIAFGAQAEENSAAVHPDASAIQTQLITRHGNSGSMLTQYSGADWASVDAEIQRNQGWRDESEDPAHQPVVGDVRFDLYDAGGKRWAALRRYGLPRDRAVGVDAPSPGTAPLGRLRGKDPGAERLTSGCCDWAVLWVAELPPVKAP